MAIITNSRPVYRRLACEMALRRKFGDRTWKEMLNELRRFDERENGDNAFTWNDRALNNYVGAYLVKDKNGVARHYNFSKDRLYRLSTLLNQDIKEMDEIYKYPEPRDCGLDIVGNYGSKVKDRDLRVIR